MKTGQYKSDWGEILQVVQIDEENKKVLVDYGNGHTHWWDEVSYKHWESLEPEHETEDIGEKNLDYQQPDEEPPTEEIKPEPKKRGRKKKDS